MNVLITGANGFLGYYLIQELLAKDFEIIATGKGNCRLPFYNNNKFFYAEMDFTDPFAVHDVFEKYRPEIVVHGGAISKPDECELNQWQAYVVNVEGTVTTLLNAAELNSFFIFVSTDFIFDGEKGMYNEMDTPNPVNYYGKTKLEAEEAVKEYEHDWAIVRTVMVYGKPILSRSNILSIVKEKLEKGEMYNVLDDQVRTPTYVEDLASAIVQVIEKRAKGVYHISGKDVMTPFQMACMTADYLGLDKKLINRVTAADFSQPAKRPILTGFDISKAKSELGFEPISFEEGLRKMFS
ncbi:MAG TPA: SDR family oxidoreductase [Chitinophagaceae bacterium]|nr:SDR family oxidoreductase [Chitinophagaceae bacterium]